jgi:hypothetical protein
VSTAFSYQLRVLLCPQCGAPVEVSPAGGASPCRFCGAHAEVGVRDDSLDQVLRPQRQPISEEERASRLRMQAGKPLIPPGNILHLFEGGALAPWRLTEAVSVWQNARRESQASGQPDAGETVYFLAQALSSVYGDQKDTARQRAVLESSLEALRLPRHRQALRCMLARLACRSGEAAAAEHWLAPCDPASDDIEMDSPYRFSRAVIATAKSDWQGVLGQLGRGPNDVPILGAMEPVCAAFRANAVERLGDVPGAAALLTGYMSQSPEHAKRLEQVLEYWAPMGLCAQCRAPAQMVRRQEQANVAAATTGGGIGPIFAVLGVLMALAGAGMLVAGLVIGSSSAAPAPAPGRHGKNVQQNVQQQVVHTAESSGLTMGGGILLLMGVIFGGVGVPIWMAAKKARRLALTGERAKAQVQSAGTTGLSINNVPQYAFTLLVQRPGASPPYQATVKALGASHIQPGMTVSVLVDPQDPKSVILELG